MARRVGIEEFCVVAFVFQEPRQDAVDQRVGARDGYCGGLLMMWVIAYRLAASLAEEGTHGPSY